MLILGVGLALVANSYMVALRGVNTAANNIEALSLAKEKLAALELESLKDGLSAFSSNGVLKSSAKSYNYAQEIINLKQPEELTKYLVQACLVVSWQEQNIEKNVILSTYLPKLRQKE